MAEHSARPRIESVGTFVLTVEEPPPAECLTFDEGDFTPSFEVIGTGSDGTIVLSDDAPVTTEDTSYALAVLIINDEYDGHTNGIPPSLSSISDDSSEPVPSYLKLDGEDCFNGAWRMKNDLGSHQSDEVDTVADDDDNEGMRLYRFGAVAYRALTNALPSGTTITYDIGNNKSVAYAVLITNAAPYTSTPKGINGSYEIPSFFDEGGIVFIFHGGTTATPNTCGIFTGTLADGAFESYDGTDIHFDVIPQFQTWWSPDGGSGPCTQTDILISYTSGWSIVAVPPGGGTAGPFGDPNGPLGWISGWAWPAQGYY